MSEPETAALEKMEQTLAELSDGEIKDEDRL
jgi:hypothetical protein